MDTLASNKALSDLSGRPSAARDDVLDCAKGLGILLVVLGHTFQNRVPNFDDFIGFTAIYSFHMPFFAFLAGAAATHWIGKISNDEGLREVAPKFASRIRRAFLQLMVPFFAWTIVSYLYERPPTPIGPYLWMVAQHPDFALWFLPCIFWCTTYMAFYLLLRCVVRSIAQDTPAERYLAPFKPFPIQMVALLALWTLTKDHSPRLLGLAFANLFFNGLFLFFVAGATLYRPFISVRNVWVRFAPYLLFAALIPFWHRTAPGNLLPDSPGILHLRVIAENYTMIVAFSGLLAAADLARLINSVGGKAISAAIRYLGIRSLAIYAIHFYFLTSWFWPPMIAPLFLSLICYETLSRIPVVRAILFGK
ncbi:acyltransferase family protein [Rhizobium sp. F40D2]|uniref:acyltransferase family protein n=1 Tax=Rhizobium sp. F40D2 TaxID=3453141 RepID=UPI003F1F6E1B